MSKRRNGKKAAGREDRQKRAKADSRYKDTVFRMLFREKARLLGLYNAIGGRSYEDPEKLDIVMLESAVYLGMKNDLAFIIDMKLYLFEHQEACLTLKEYMQYVDKVRGYAKDMSIDEAVDRAVDECIKQWILREFLLQNKAEVKHMSIFEYNEEDVRRVLREEAHDEGYEEGYEEGKNDGKVAGKIEGKIEALLYLLEEKGTVPEALERRIKAETDENTLRKWLRFAGKIRSIEEFQMGL